MASVTPRDEYPTPRRTDPLRRGSAQGHRRAEYTDDIKRPGMLFGGLLRSPWPHARLVSIDVSAARAIPGVYAVLTGEKYPTPFGVLPITHDETAIAVGKARYIGDIIAAVAASDERTAERALGAIRVESEPLPEYADPQIGLLPVAEPIHARGLAGTNIQKEVVQHFGDVDAAFAQATPYGPSPGHLRRGHARLHRADGDDRRGDPGRPSHRLERDPGPALPASGALRGARHPDAPDPRDQAGGRRRVRRQVGPPSPRDRLRGARDRDRDDRSRSASTARTSS